jgi:hypothetical protein
MDNPVLTPLDSFTNISVKILLIGILIYFIYTTLKGKPSGIVFICGLLFIYIYYYFTGRQYLRENFEHLDVNPIETIVENNDVIVENLNNKPYSTTPINSLDDYEHNLVFQNENDREITKELRTKLMSQYPMDWSVQPGSSSHFTKGVKEYSKGYMPIDESQNEMIYKNVSGDNLQPPDMDAVETEERKILQTYVPKATNDLKTYDIEDANTLIKKIYDARGLIPEVTHEKDTNVYTIVGTRRKGEKIQYEDDLEDAEASDEAVTENQESVTVVPQAARDILNDSDPFYNTKKKTRMDKWDYTKYTPELERMFAPSHAMSQWY